MERELIIIGGGEHARVVGEAARAAGFQLVGFVDPRPSDAMARQLDIPHLGGDEAVVEHPDALLVLGVGDLGTGSRRQQIIERIGADTKRWTSVVHPRAWVSPSATLGPGTVVMAGAVVQGSAETGLHCVVNSAAVVEHDGRLGDFVQLGPRAVLGGGTHVGHGSYVGLGACVRDHIKIGARCLVGMGSVVVDDVQDGQHVRGVPARPVEE